MTYDEALRSAYQYAQHFDKLRHEIDGKEKTILDAAPLSLLGDVDWADLVKTLGVLTGAFEPDPKPSKSLYEQYAEDGWQEGWLVSTVNGGRRDDGSPHVELQHYHDDPQFLLRTDGAAWHVVVEQARRGSALHLEALAMCDPTEQSYIRRLCGDWQKPA